MQQAKLLGCIRAAWCLGLLVVSCLYPCLAALPDPVDGGDSGDRENDELKRSQALLVSVLGPLLRATADKVRGQIAKIVKQDRDGVTFESEIEELYVVFEHVLIFFGVVLFRKSMLVLLSRILFTAVALLVWTFSLELGDPQMEKIFELIQFEKIKFDDLVKLRTHLKMLIRRLFEYVMLNGKPRKTDEKADGIQSSVSASTGNGKE